jgi:hypothetical protein
LAEASQPIARRTNVSGQCEVRAWRERTPSDQPQAHEGRGEGTVGALCSAQVRGRRRRAGLD